MIASARTHTHAVVGQCGASCCITERKRWREGEEGWSERASEEDIDCYSGDEEGWEGRSPNHCMERVGEGGERATMQRKEVGGEGGRGERRRAGGRVGESEGEVEWRRATRRVSLSHKHIHTRTSYAPSLPFPLPLYTPHPSTWSYDPHLHPSSENKDPFHHFLLAGKQQM